MRAGAPERLLAATVTRSASTCATPEPGGGVAPAFLAKRNSGPIRGRGSTGDDAALSRLAMRRAHTDPAAGPAFVLAGVTSEVFV